MFKQRRITAWGLIRQSINHLMLYMGMINFGLIIITAYHTTVSEVTSIPFYAYLGFIVMVWISALVVEYKISIPSNLGFMADQAYKHGSIVPKEVEAIRAELAEIRKILAANEAMNRARPLVIGASDWPGNNNRKGAKCDLEAVSGKL